MAIDVEKLSPYDRDMLQVFRYIERLERAARRVTRMTIRHHGLPGAMAKLNAVLQAQRRKCGK